MIERLGHGFPNQLHEFMGNDDLFSGRGRGWESEDSSNEDENPVYAPSSSR